MDVAAPAARGQVSALVGDVEDQAVPVVQAGKDLADLPVVAVAVVLRVDHLAVPAALVAVVRKAGPLVEDGQDLTPSEC